MDGLEAYGAFTNLLIVGHLCETYAVHGTPRMFEHMSAKYGLT